MQSKDSLKRLRDQYLSPSLSLSYKEPLHIVSGQGQYLYDSDGCGLDNWWEQEMMKTTDDKWLVLFDCHN